jgi:hypothetical protein
MRRWRRRRRIDAHADSQSHAYTPAESHAHTNAGSHADPKPDADPHRIVQHA